ncbi:MAG: YigZ family protein [Bacteroidales bacterium]|nr:YigZ family protein [Bacteroidales bacterium]
MSDIYKSISSRGQGLYKDSGSRFIAFAIPVETDDEVRELVSGFRKEYHDARHHCYAYRIGAKGETWRASDDGEPSGTAGRPILGQIDSAGLSDILIVVVRYFGGIKLGVPGLIKAYKSATADALANAPVCKKIAGDWYRIGFGYDAMPQVMKMVKDLDLPQRNREFGSDCSMELRVRCSLREDFLERTSTICTFVDLL